MHGGMAGSHLRWSVYEDMVNKVWPQCCEQERRNIWLIMRRDLGWSWRPDGWNGHAHMEEKGEGLWKPKDKIFDETPWRYFRQVLARFDPDNQWAVTVRVENSEQLDSVLRLTPAASIIKQPSLAHIRKSDKWESDTTTVTVRTYKWQNEYRIDWNRRCDENAIVSTEKLNIPDDKTM